MLFLGIDIASKKHDCCIMGQNAEILDPILHLKIMPKVMKYC